MLTNPARTFEELDAISRTRALTNAESLRLERAIKAIDTSRGIRFHWTPGREARLKHCIEIEGMTFEQAGAALGCNRNQALGKYARMRKVGA